MNFERVIVFGVALYMLRLVAGIAAGFFQVDLPVVFQYVLFYGLDSLVVVVVFAKLGELQSNLTGVHVLLVIALSLVLGWLTELALKTHMGIEAGPDPLWFIEYVNFLVSICVGLAIGKRMRAAVH